MQHICVNIFIYVISDILHVYSNRLSANSSYYFNVSNIIIFKKLDGILGPVLQPLSFV